MLSLYAISSSAAAGSFLTTPSLKPFFQSCLAGLLKDLIFFISQHGKDAGHSWNDLVVEIIFSIVLSFFNLFH